MAPQPPAGRICRCANRWNEAEAEAFWNDPKPCPRLRIEAQGVELFVLDALPPRAWVQLDFQQAARLADVLPSTSLLTVHGDGTNPGMLLVQEEGMWRKPSLLLRLSAADILRYWSLLTTAQRAAFLEVPSGRSHRNRAGCRPRHPRASGRGGAVDVRIGSPACFTRLAASSAPC